MPLYPYPFICSFLFYVLFIYISRHSANELFKRTCSQSLQLPSSEATPGVFELYPTMKDLSINNETRDLNLNITQSMPVDEEVKWLGRNQISRNKCEQVLESNGATLSLSRPAESLNQPIKSKSIELASKQCEVLRQKAAQLLERIDRQEEQLKKKLILRTTSASSVSSSVCSSHSMSMSSLPACPPACLPVIHSCVVVPCAKERIDNSRDPSKTILNCRDDLRQPQLTHNRSSSLLEEDLLFNFLKMELELD